MIVVNSLHRLAVVAGALVGAMVEKSSPGNAMRGIFFELTEKEIYLAKKKLIHGWVGNRIIFLIAWWLIKSKPLVAIWTTHSTTTKKCVFFMNSVQRAWRFSVMEPRSQALIQSNHKNLGGTSGCPKSDGFNV